MSSKDRCRCEGREEKGLDDIASLSTFDNRNKMDSVLLFFATHRQLVITRSFFAAAGGRRFFSLSLFSSSSAVDVKPSTRSEDKNERARKTNVCVFFFSLAFLALFFFL